MEFKKNGAGEREFSGPTGGRPKLSGVHRNWLLFELYILMHVEF